MELDLALWKVFLAVAFALVVIKLGLGLLRGLAAPTPEPPPPGEMRRVKLEYRCAICGTEVRMTAAPDQEPPPPRHCLEDMQLVAPIE
jgi:hypothetical protein